MRSGSGMTLVPELSVTPDDPHVRRFSPPEPKRQVSLVMRRPFVRRKLIEAFATAIRASLPEQLRDRSLSAGTVVPITR
ncbi:MAG: hypothetical protein IPK99_01520 [Flavobacteriales bacterium]|nr:hypothetical protein [Flavobacteriales bacterium]